MAELQVLGLYNNLEQTAEAITSLHAMGISDRQITIMSGAPYKAEFLGRPHEHNRVGCASFFGAILGLIIATILTVGLFLLYPLYQGGQPLVPIPPSLIVYFEVTMLGTMWAAFLGMLLLSGLPSFRKQAYDSRITAGLFGLQVLTPEERAAEIEALLRKFNPVDVSHTPGEPLIDQKFRIFWGSLALGLTGLVVLALLFWYDVIPFNFPSNMVDQDSFGFEQGPRLAAPAESVPIQGLAVIANQPASSPLPASPDSLQRGTVLYNINCLGCHGPTGVGNGPTGVFFNPRPFDLGSASVQSLSSEQIFMVISQGFENMPTLAENLRPSERWDVENYVRTLKR
jgi:mono/diheme cytochrome c family protein